MSLCYREEYEASREPFEDEKQLCVMLVTYLQRHLALMDPASVSGGSDTLSDSSPRACELGPVEDTSPNPGPGMLVFVTLIDASLSNSVSSSFTMSYALFWTLVGKY